MTPEERANEVPLPFGIRDGAELRRVAREAIASAITAAVAEREQELLPFIPDPQAFSGWDDESAPEEILRGLAALARLKGIEMPPHLAARNKS